VTSMTNTTIPKCQICGRQAEYVCQECGMLVCRFHYDPYHRVCSECLKKLLKSSRKFEEEYFEPANFEPLESKLFIIGFILIIIGVLLPLLLIPLMAGGKAKVTTTGGIIIIPGIPIPLGFAWGKYGLVIAIVLIIIGLVIYFLTRRTFRRSASQEF